MMTVYLCKYCGRKEIIERYYFELTEDRCKICGTKFTYKEELTEEDRDVYGYNKKEKQIKKINQYAEKKKID